MKQFSNFNELWEYCLYCPICKKSERKMEVIIGPEDTCRLTSYLKKSKDLELRVKTRDSDSLVHKYEFIIDCVSNTFVINKKYNYSPDIDIFYLYLFSNCDDCDSYINTSDINLDMKLSILDTISLDQEGINLLSVKDKYNIISDHTNQHLIISKLYPSNDDLQKIRISKRHTTLPLIELNYSDQLSVSQKIKTLLMFS